MLSEKCLTTCQDRVLTRNKCICTSSVVGTGDKKGGNPWCYVHCGGGGGGRVTAAPYKTFLFNRSWDYVDSLKPKKVCLTQKDKYVSCVLSGDETKKKTKNRPQGVGTEALLLDRYHLIILGLLAWRLLAHVFVKTQASDKSARQAVAADMRNVVQVLADRGDLSLEARADLTDKIKQTLQSASWRDIITNYRRFLITQSGKTKPDPLAANDELMLDRLSDLLDEKQFSEFIRGAQIQISGDEGKLYREISERKGAFTRFSTHHPLVKDTPHRAISEQVYGRTYHLLSGKTPEGNSWLQLEASPWAPGLTFLEVGVAVAADPVTLLPSSLDHVIDFIVHKATHRNIGPLGASDFGEWNPIVVEKAVRSRLGTTLQEQQISRFIEMLPNKSISASNTSDFTLDQSLPSSLGRIQNNNTWINFLISSSSPASSSLLLAM